MENIVLEYINDLKSRIRELESKGNATGSRDFTQIQISKFIEHIVENNGYDLRNMEKLNFDDYYYREIYNKYQFVTDLKTLLDCIRHAKLRMEDIKKQELRKQ